MSAKRIDLQMVALDCRCAAKDRHHHSTTRRMWIDGQWLFIERGEPDGPMVISRCHITHITEAQDK